MVLKYVGMYTLETEHNLLWFAIKHVNLSVMMRQFP